MEDANGKTLNTLDWVIVPDPNETDLHNNGFVGQIVHIGDEFVTVEDGNGDCFDIEPERLYYADENQPPRHQGNDKNRSNKR
jgi:hypothetical protein